MYRVSFIVFASGLLVGCSGAPNPFSSLSSGGGGPSNNVEDQRICEEKGGKFGAGAILDCRLEMKRRREAAGAAGPTAPTR